MNISSEQVNSGISLKNCIFLVFGTSPIGNIKIACQKAGIYDEKNIKALEKSNTALERAEILQQYLVFSPDNSPKEKLLIALLSKDLDYAEKSEHIINALNEIQDLSLSILGVSGITKNVFEIRKQIQVTTTSLIESIIEISGTYPDISKESIKKFKDGIMGILNPNKSSNQDKIVSIFSFFELIKPYLAQRMLSFQTYNKETHKEYREEIFNDVGVIISFYDSIKDAVEFAMSEKSKLSESELANDIEKDLPFILKVLEDSFEIEFDFQAERKAQEKAYVMFSKYSDIIIPKVIPEISNEEIIAMDRSDAKRIEELPANPKIIKNIFILLRVLLKNNFLHGDLHGGNLKGLENGNIVVYDWGQHSEITEGFFRNIKEYIYALIKNKPNDIAKYFCLLQDTGFGQSTEQEIQKIVDMVLKVQKNRKSDNSNPENKDISQKIKEKFLKRIKKIVELQRMVLVTAGLRHQSTIDRNTTHFMRSGASLFLLIGKELTKPEYGGLFKKVVILSKCYREATKEILKLNN